MNRTEYRALSRRVRTAAKDGMRHQWHTVAAERFENRGAAYVRIVKRSDDSGRAAYSVETAIASGPAHRKHAAESLAWAAEFRRLITTRRYDRPRALAMVRACIAEAAGYRAGFANYLPG